MSVDHVFTEDQDVVAVASSKPRGTGRTPLITKGCWYKITKVVSPTHQYVQVRNDKGVLVFYDRTLFAPGLPLSAVNELDVTQMSEATP